MIRERRFKKTLTRYRDLVYRQAYYFTGNNEDAADITQEVFMKYWVNIGQVRRNSMKSWLLTVTRNACIDQLRRRRIVPESVLSASGGLEHDLPVWETADPGHGPEQLAEVCDLRGQLVQALTALHPVMRMAVILREIERCSYQEVADVLELPLNTVKVYLHRAKRMMALRLISYQRQEHNNEMSRL